jgi:hypothetical protein
MTAPGTLTGDLSERILAAVRTAAKPVTFNYLLKVAKAEKSETEEALAHAINRGQLHRWPDYRRSQYFWHASAEEKAREAVLAAAAAQALSKPALSKAAAKKLRGFSEKRMDNVVSALLSEKQLKAVPAFTGNSKLLVRPGDTQTYFRAAQAFIEERIRKAGFDPAAFSTHDKPAAESGAAAALILEAVRALEPVRGVPVSTLRLRNHLPAIEKREFDSAAMELRAKHEVFLNLHTDTYNISQSEKDLLIDGGDGTFYVAISLR